MDNKADLALEQASEKLRDAIELLANYWADAPIGEIDLQDFARNRVYSAEQSNLPRSPEDDEALSDTEQDRLNELWEQQVAKEIEKIESENWTYRDLLEHKPESTTKDIAQQADWVMYLMLTECLNTEKDALYERTPKDWIYFALASELHFTFNLLFEQPGQKKRRHNKTRQTCTRERHPVDG